LHVSPFDPRRQRRPLIDFSVSKMNETPQLADQPSANKRPEWGLGLKIAFIVFGFIPAMVFAAGCAWAIYVVYSDWLK